MKVAIYTLGCKVNQYETQAMEQELLARGHTLTEFSDEADAYIVNTCSVTAVSDQKSRQVIHGVQRKHPGAVVAVCGCYPQTHADDVRKLGVLSAFWKRPRGRSGRSRPSTSLLSGGCSRSCPPAAWGAAPGLC